MTVPSILFERTKIKETLEAPAFFGDLNLDQIIDSITADKQEYNLKPFYNTSLKDIDAINYRQEIFKDLENKILFKYIKSFAQKMLAMREHFTQADKLYYSYQKKSWFLDALEIYCEAVNCLTGDLILTDLKSRGLLTFREYITNYAKSGDFTSLLAETKKLKADLSAVKYCLLIEGYSTRVRKNAICIEVRQFESEIDYSAEVEILPV